MSAEHRGQLRDIMSAMTGPSSTSQDTAATAPTVAIVLRTRNRPQLLPRALASIGAQSYRDFRVVVVNDGGDAHQVARQVGECAAVRGRVDIVTNTQSVGREAAMNTGVNNSDSTYLVIHDDDDSWHPDFLHRSIAYLENSPDGAVATRTEIVFEEVTEEGIRELGRDVLAADKSQVTLGEVLRANFTPPISVLYRRSVHDAVGLYDGSLPVLADWDFMLRLLSAYTVGFIDGPPLAYWHHRASSGDLGNSVVVASEDHARFAGVIRDRYLRAGLPLNGGLGVSLQIAAEAQHLDKVGQRRHEHVDWRLGEIEGHVVAGLLEANRHLVSQGNRMVARLQEIQARLDDIERTQLSQTPRVRLRTYLRAASELSARLGRRSRER